MINPLRSLLVPGSGTQILGAANALGARIAESIGCAIHRRRLREELAHMGYAGVIYANAALQASMLAMETVLRHLHDVGHLGGAEHMLTTYPSRREHVGFYAWMQLQKRY